MTTKEQERTAIELIRRTLEGLGKDSYLAAAMDGVLEVAEENINDDAMYSWKSRAEIARRDLRAAEEELKKKESEMKAMQEHIKQLQQHMKEEKQELSERRMEYINLRLNSVDREDLTNIVKIYRDSQAEKAKDAAESMAFAVLKGEDARDYAMRYRDAESQIERCAELEERLDKYK